MASMIDQYRNKSGPIVVVVGDAHLREKFNPIMGNPSVIQHRFAGVAVIERAPAHLKEAE